MTAWPPWDASHPELLLRYVQQDAVSLLLPYRLVHGLPGPLTTGPLERLRKLVDTFLQAGVSYTGEPTSSPRGRQCIRPPEQVLVRPRHATCVDLAVTFAGACLDAALHPLIVIADPVNRAEPRHSVVVVWLRGNWEGERAAGYPLSQAVHNGVPPEITQGLRLAAGRPGDFIALDLTAAIRPTDDSDPFGSASRAGAAVITGTDEWAGRQTIDVGARYLRDEAFPVMPAPNTVPIRPAYLNVDAAISPLQQLRARNGRVRFQRRDELDVIRYWCESADPQGPPQITVLHGAGGAGKTHLAAELAAQLADANWYCGFLARSPDPEGLRWLGGIVSPLLVVVDYPEATRAADVVALVKALQDRPAGPACILLTARTIGPWWQRDILDPLQADGYRYRALPPVPLSDRHPQADAVYRRAVRAFAPPAAAFDPSLPAAELGETTLDLILLGWLAAQGIADLPPDRDALYRAALDSELRYWGRAIAEQINTDLPDPVLRAMGACLALLAPEADRVVKVFEAIGLLRNNGAWRRSIANVIVRLLPPDTEDGTVVVRPDPVSDHLLLTTFSADPGLLARAVAMAAGEEQLHLCLSLTRAAHAAPSQAEDLADIVLRTDAALWRPALKVVAAQGAGPFETALARQAEGGEVAELSTELAATPAGHATLRRLALLAAQRPLPDPPVTAVTPADLESFVGIAADSNNLSIRQADMGLRQDALRSAERSVNIYRALAQAFPEVFADELASTLSNLAGRQSSMGLRVEALASLEEALGISRALADDDPNRYLPALTVVMHNLALRQSDLGRRGEALATISEAVRLRRELVAAASTADDELGERQADLASALDNQAVRQAALGRYREALDSAEEAVDLHRGLANRWPGRFDHALAVSLDTVSQRLAEVGRPHDALRAAAEAVVVHGRLVEVNADAFTPPLALSTENLAARQLALGLAVQALQSAQEAVEIRRRLADALPAVFTHDLAAALVTLANCHSESGNHEQAREASAQAVALLRPLAESQSAAFSGNLAAALNNLAVHQAELGHGQAALEHVCESAGIWRALAAAEPGAHEAELGSSLTNLSYLEAEAGLYDQALTSAGEAVSLLFRLHEENPSAFAWPLAMALTSLTHQLAAVGQFTAALDRAQEVAALTVPLAEADMTAYGHRLAIALTNLANRQAAVGQRWQAHASVEQAVQIYRVLSADQPRRFRRDLALALNNLANYQEDAGLTEAALGSAEDAVALRREEQADTKGSSPSDLATVLHTLALLQIRAGLTPDALANVTEEVRILRSLAEVQSLSARSDLAGALNNLAAIQKLNGDLPEAVRTAQEVLELRRVLADENPGAYRPALASALANLASHYAALGQLTEAAQAADDAIGIYRELSADTPDAAASELAVALVNQTSVLIKLDPARALAFIAEAVTIRRALVQAFPVAELPRLVHAVNVQAELYETLNDQEAAIQAYAAALDQLPTVAQSELLATRASWRLKRGDSNGAGTDLAEAARLAVEAGDAPGIGHARRTIRQAALELPESPAVALSGAFPPWATAQIQQEVIDYANEWTGSESVAERAGLVWNISPDLLTSQGRAALSAIHALNPEHHELAELLDLLAAVRSQGAQTAVSEWAVKAQAQAALTQWMSIPTWSQSLAYLGDHPQFLQQPGLWELMESRKDDSLVSAHILVARLTRRFPLADLSDILDDPALAADAVMDALERSETHLAEDLLTAVPGLATFTFAGRIVAAPVQGLRPGATAESQADAEHLVRRIAPAPSQMERLAAIARLRRLSHLAPTWAESLAPLIRSLDGSGPGLS